MSGQFQVQVPQGLVPGQMFQVRKKQDDRRRVTSRRDCERARWWWPEKELARVLGFAFAHFICFAFVPSAR